MSFFVAAALALAATAAAQNSTVASTNGTTTDAVDAFPPGLTCVEFVKAGDNVNIPKSLTPCNGVGTDGRAKQCAFFSFDCTSTTADCLPEWAGLTVTSALCVSESLCDEIKTSRFYRKGSVCCSANACNDPDKQPSAAAALTAFSALVSIAVVTLFAF